VNINSISTPTITTNFINQTAQGKTVIQNKNNWVSESDKRVQALDDKYRKINEQNKQFKNPIDHIIDKYGNQNSPYFRSDLTETERDASLSSELCWFKNGLLGCYDFRDSLFRKDASGEREVELATYGLYA